MGNDRQDLNVKAKRKRQAQMRNTVNYMDNLVDRLFAIVEDIVDYDGLTYQEKRKLIKTTLTKYDETTHTAFAEFVAWFDGFEELRVR
jgi:hypothetical protein